MFDDTLPWDETLKYWGHEDLEFTYRGGLKGMWFLRCSYPICAHMRHADKRYASDLFSRNLKSILSRYGNGMSTSERTHLEEMAQDPHVTIPEFEPGSLHAFVHLSRDVDEVILSAKGSFFVADDFARRVDRLEYRWESDDERSASPLSLTSEEAVVKLKPPKKNGSYYIELCVKKDDKLSRATAYFEVVEGGLVLPDYEKPPPWTDPLIIYEVYPPVLTGGGDLEKLGEELPRIKELGATCLLITPLCNDGSAQEMPDKFCAGGLRNASGHVLEMDPCYSAINLMEVSSFYGNEAAVRRFVKRVHEAGMKIILDFPVNHLGVMHPAVVDARDRGKDSLYWDWLEHGLPYHNTNNLDQSVTPDLSFTYYSFWDLANLSWKSPGLRRHMLKVMRWWLDEFKFDGFRFDAWWGPHRRYGSAFIDIPVRQGLRRSHPGTLLVGEAEGRESDGYEMYPENGGGLDYAFDWSTHWQGFRWLWKNLKQAARPAILDEKKVPRLIRFLENHDEQRVVYQVNSVERTFPLATLLLTTPGVPLLYCGQEFGYGKGLSRWIGKRGTARRDGPDADIVQRHYRTLAELRKKYHSLRSDQSRLLSLDRDHGTLVFLREGKDGPTVVALNISAEKRKVDVECDWFGRDVTCLLDLYSGVHRSVTKSKMSLELEPYGCAILKSHDG